MFLEIPVEQKAFPADIAVVGPRILVKSLMGSHVALVRKSFTAVSTFKRLLPCVFIHVRPQVAFVREEFLANFASVNPEAIACYVLVFKVFGHKMASQIVWMFEGFPTLRADMGWAVVMVCQFVGVQATSLIKGHPTGITHVAPLIQVNFLVFLPYAVCGEMLGAKLALVRLLARMSSFVRQKGLFVLK